MTYAFRTKTARSSLLSFQAHGHMDIQLQEFLVAYDDHMKGTDKI